MELRKKDLIKGNYYTVTNMNYKFPCVIYYKEELNIGSKNHYINAADDINDISYNFSTCGSADCNLFRESTIEEIGLLRSKAAKKGINLPIKTQDFNIWN